MLASSPGCAVLVGRDRELSELVAECLTGPGGFSLVEAEVGGGKTRLLEEVTARAAAAGARVVCGRAVPGGGPYRPLTEALARIAAPSLAERERLVPFRGVLAWILPAWPAGPGQRPYAVDPVVVLGEALIELLAALSEDTRMVVVLDDLHWADADTLAVLEYLARGLVGLPVRVLCAARSDERPPEGLSLLRRHPDVGVQELARLDQQQAGRLADSVLGQDLDTSIRDYVVAASEGLPLLVEELCVGLVEASALRRRDGRWVPAGRLHARVPEAFAETVARRVAGLDPADREVVRVTALLGRDLSWELVPAASGTDAAAAAGALRAAVDARLLVNGPDGVLRWRHALTQDAVLAVLTGPECALLASRAAAAMDRPGLSGPKLALVAGLHARGGAPGRAAELLLRYAREHRGTGAPAAALAALEQASALADDELRVPVAVERVDVLALSARTDDALAVGEHLLAGAAGSQRAALAVALARACVATERFAAAESYLDRAGDARDPRVLALSAHVALGVGDVGEALRRAEAAVAAAERDGPPDAACEALEVAGRGRRRSDPAGSQEAFRRAEQLAALNGLTAWRIRALSELGVNDLFGTGDGDSLARAEELARAAGMLGTATMLELQQVALTYGAEGPIAAMARAERCAEHAGRLGLTGLRGHALMFVARGSVFADRATESGPLLARAASLSAHPVHIDSSRFYVRACDAWLGGDPAAAAAELDSCVDVLRRAEGSNPAPVWGEWAVLRTALDPTDPRAREELRSSDVLVQALNRAALHYCDAVASTENGRPDDAIGQLSSADELLVRRPFQRCLLRGLLLEHRVLGDPVPELYEALAWLSGTGEARMVRRCRDRLRALGAPVPRPDRDSIGVPPGLRAIGVTGREMEVLRLLADGLGNPDIAARLQLSRRTVETHVGNLLAKTGATGRAGLPRWLGDMSRQDQ